MAKKSLSKWLLLGILILATFLRFYRIRENLIFHGEIGFDYLSIKEILEGKKTPLLGPPTSHPWLSLSPLFYWLFLLVLPVFDWHPIGGSYFMALMGVLAVFLIYLVIKRFLGEETALVASFLLAISPSWITLTRHSRFNSISALLFLPFLYFLVRSLNEKGKYLFLTGIVLGLMYSFFPTILTLIPATLVLLFIKRKEIKKKYLWHGLLGLFIPNTPFLIYNAQNRFEMITKLIVWVPYRVAGFFGLYPKNNVSTAVLKVNLQSLYVFFRESFLPYENVLGIIIFWSLILFLVIKIRASLVKKDNFWLSIIIIFVVTYIGLFLHGDPPRHYYLSMFPLPIIFAGLFLDWLLKRNAKFLVLSILLLFSVVNLSYFFSEKWFYIPQDKVVKGNLPVPYNIQERIAEFIIEDARSEVFQLKRVGPLDHFDEDFAQNYKYLLWRLEKEPVSKADLTYTIFEGADEVSEDEEVFWISNVAILKSEKEE